MRISFMILCIVIAIGAQTRNRTVMMPEQTIIASIPDSITAYKTRVELSEIAVLDAVRSKTETLTRKGEKLALQAIARAKADYALAQQQYHEYCAANAPDENDARLHRVAAWKCKRQYEAAMTAYYQALDVEQPEIQHTRLKLSTQG